MKKFGWLGLVALGLQHPCAAATPDWATKYLEEGRNLVKIFIDNAQEIKPTELKIRLETMSDHAATASKDYVKKFPEGKKMFDLIFANLGEIKKASSSVLEEQWHDAAFFKDKDIGIDLNAEVNEHFTNALHAILHPLLTLRAAERFSQTKDAKERVTMKTELEEGLQQMESLLEKLGYR